VDLLRCSGPRLSSDPPVVVQPRYRATHRRQACGVHCGTAAGRVELRHVQPDRREMRQVRGLTLRQVDSRAGHEVLGDSGAERCGVRRPGHVGPAALHGLQEVLAS